MNIIYDMAIYPIRFLIETIFYIFKDNLGFSYGISVILLSIAVNIIISPFINIAEKWHRKEADIKNAMKKELDVIKKSFKGDERYLLIRTCYRLHNYNPIFSIRTVLSPLIQIPFFIAAYSFLSNLPDIENQSFLMLNDLSKPDALTITIKAAQMNATHFITAFGDLKIIINILPIIMAFFSFMSGHIYSKGLTLKEKLPLLILPLLFLIILYNSPSILLIYWTLNTFISFMRNFFNKNFFNKNILNKNRIGLSDLSVKFKLKKKLIFKIYVIISVSLLSFVLILNILQSVFNNGIIDNLELMHETKNGYVYKGKFNFNKILYPKIFYRLKDRKLKIKNYGDIKNYSVYIGEGASHWYDKNIGKVIKNQDGTWTGINSRSHNTFGYIIPLIEGEKYKIEVEAKRVSGKGGSITYYLDELNKKIEIPYSYNISEDYKTFTDIRKIYKTKTNQHPHFYICLPNGEVNIKHISIEQLGDYLYLREDNSVIFNSKDKIESVKNIKYNIKINPLFYYFLFVILLIYPLYILLCGFNRLKNIVYRFSKRKYLLGFLILFAVFLITIIFYSLSNFSYKTRLTDLQLIENSRLGYIYKAKLNFKGIFSPNILYRLNKNSIRYLDTNNIKTGFRLDIRRNPDWFYTHNAEIYYNYNNDGFIASNSVGYNSYNYIIPLTVGEEYKVSVKAKKISEINRGSITLYLDEANKNIVIPNTDSIPEDYEIFSGIHNIRATGVNPIYPHFYINLSSGVIAVEYIQIEEISGAVHIKDDDSIIFTSKDMLDYVDISYNIIFNKALFLIFLLFSFIFLLILFRDKISSYDFKLNNPVYILISSCLTLTILAGFFIIPTVISSSPLEFSNKYSLIFSNFFKCIGLFFIYPIIVYYLFNKTVKNILLFLMAILTLISLSNVFLMNLDYGNINANFKFDNADLLISSIKDTIFNIILILSSIFIIIFVFIKKKYRLIINIFFLISFSLLIISLINISNISKSDIETFKINKENLMLNSGEDVFNVSRTGTNIFVITLDRAIPSYWHKAFESFPERKKQFDGFTFYLNNTSFAWNTIASIQTLYGGYEYTPYEISVNKKYKLEDMYIESALMLPQLLKNYGYQSTIYNYALDSPIFYYFSSLPKEYTNITIFREYNDIDNLIQNNMDFLDYENIITQNNGNNADNEIVADMSFKFSVLKILPSFLRYYFYNSYYGIQSSKKLQYINTSIKDFSDLYFLKDKIKINDTGNYFINFYTAVTHEPDYFNSDYLPSYERREIPQKDIDIFKNEISARHYYVNVSSIDLIIKFINFLKDNDIYDNTKIIIASDHGHSLNSEMFSEEENKFITRFHSLLLVKDFNDRGEIKISSNFMTAAEVPYLAVNHLDNPTNPFTGKPITNDAKNNGVNIIKLKHWSISFQFENAFGFDGYYKVKDNIFKSDNWKEYKYNR